MFKSFFSSRVNPLPLSAQFSSSTVVVDPLRDGKFNTSSPSPPPQLDEQKKTEWCSIYLAALFTFMASIQYTLFITSLWPFMQILDPTVTVGFFGAVIAMYSLSQIVASPLMGIWTNRIGIFRPPLFVCQKPPNSCSVQIFSISFQDSLQFLHVHWKCHVFLGGIVPGRVESLCFVAITTDCRHWIGQVIPIELGGIIGSTKYNPTLSSL
jgi:MFS family permease